METRSIRSWTFRLLISLVVFSRAASTCESLETEHGVLGRNHVCTGDLSTLESATHHHDNISDVKISSSALSPNHEVRISPGKGLGMFATRFIPQGTTILIEEPIIEVGVPEMIQGHGFRIADMTADLSSAFKVLTSSEQEEVMSLHDFRYPNEAEAAEQESHLLTIFRSNAYNTGHDKVGLFPKTARINHSCRPSAGNWWSEKRQRAVIYALRNIEEGEEITVSYIPLLKSTSERQARLRQYGFVCDCSACSDESGVGDKRRVKIDEFLEDLEGKMGRKSMKGDVTKKRVKKARKLIDMVEDEELGDYVARAYHLGAVFCEHAGDLKEAQRWARKEQEVLEWPEKDSEKALASARHLENLGTA